ncbi:hypothetical protein [Endozoicomonas numazuensis]|uniref:hypothetical protein n=1 Tax=Endozoicomonas numazuensis TaxID=1137799 RepID=UPI000B09DBD7|nr:hypothetical protein [Endozoicomonas numazuensis]
MSIKTNPVTTAWMQELEQRRSSWPLYGAPSGRLREVSLLRSNRLKDVDIPARLRLVLSPLSADEHDK